jgi:acyl-CoA hydrolase
VLRGHVHHVRPRKSDRRALISVAHPDFRSELRNYAKEVKYFILPEHEA